MMPVADAKSRLQALRRLLQREVASTQEELREQLEALDFDVNQSTVSRDLRRIGAIKMTDVDGRTTYRLSGEASPVPVKASGLLNLVRDIRHNGFLIVISTDPGSASLIARHIDALRSEEVLGTIAGDDAIFVAPANPKKIMTLVRLLKESFGGG